MWLSLFPPVVFRSPAHLGWVLVTTGSPHGQGKAVSLPKVSLGSASLAERSETLTGGLGSVAVMPLTLKLEMPSSSHMLWLLAFDGNHGVGMGDHGAGRVRLGALIRLPYVYTRICGSVVGFDTQRPSRELPSGRGPLEGSTVPRQLLKFLSFEPFNNRIRRVPGY